MKKTILFAVAATAVCDCLAAERLSLARLESMVMSAPLVRIADTEREAAEARHYIAVAALSPKLFVSATVASAKDPVRPERYDIETTQAGGAVARSETVLTAAQDRYTRYGALVGVRVPLFGSRMVLLKNIGVAEAGIGVAKAKLAVAQMEALKGLRYAYVDYYYRQAQVRLAKTFIQSSDEVTGILEQRRKAKLLLDAEYKSLRIAFHGARNEIGAAQAAADDSADRIRMFTGYALTDIEVQPPALPRTCRTYPDGGQPAGGLHPALIVYASALEERRRALGMTGSSLPYSEFTVSQGLNRYDNGRSGNSTAVSIDFQFPIGGPSPSDAAKRLAISEVARAELEFDQQKAEYLAAVEKAKRNVELGRSQITLAAQRLDASKEAQRVARLRVAQPDADAVERMVRTKAVLYNAYHDHLEAELRLARAQIDIMGLAQCDADQVPEPSVLDEALPIFMQALLPGHALEYKLTGLQPADPASAPIPYKVPVLSWYAWHTLSRFDASKENAFWARIPATSRVLLSLNGEQIKGAIHNVNERRRLAAFLSSADKRHVAVGLLLGDPGWVLPGEGEKLIAIVRELKGVPFSGIHLDIEESQLPEEKRSEWAPGLVALVKALRAETTLPIAVSLHPRDARVEGLLAQLKAAGTNEVALMLYSTNHEKVAGDLATIMRAHPGLRFSVAQSIEPALSNEESYAKKSEAVANAAWRSIDERLRTEPNFAGIIIQSLDDYLDGVLRHEN